MKNIYHRDIMEFLLPCGAEGMRVCRLARRVYNLHTDLFSHDLDYKDLYRSLHLYLWRQSRLRRSPFMRPRRGFYAIKPNIAVQLDIFVDTKPIEPSSRAEKKKSHPATQLLLEF